MSLINDALKQARRDPAPGTPRPPLPPHRPVGGGMPSAAAWLVPAIAIVLVVAIIFFVGWAVARHSVRTIAATPDPVIVTQQVAELTLPAIVPPPPPPPPAEAPALPRLQGIFYSPTAPTAILDGKTVRPGDRFGQYRVKEITRYTVTLADADGKTVQLGMGN